MAGAYFFVIPLPMAPHVDDTPPCCRRSPLVVRELKVFFLLSSCFSCLWNVKPPWISALSPWNLPIKNIFQLSLGQNMGCVSGLWPVWGWHLKHRFLNRIEWPFGDELWNKTLSRHLSLMPAAMVEAHLSMGDAAQAMQMKHHENKTFTEAREEGFCTQQSPDEAFVDKCICVSGNLD